MFYSDDDCRKYPKIRRIFEDNVVNRTDWKSLALKMSVLLPLQSLCWTSATAIESVDVKWRHRERIARNVIQMSLLPISVAAALHFGIICTTDEMNTLRCKVECSVIFVMKMAPLHIVGMHRWNALKWSDFHLGTCCLDKKQNTSPRLASILCLHVCANT